MARVPDWLIYGGIVAVLTGIGLSRLSDDAPSSPKPVGPDRPPLEARPEAEVEVDREDLGALLGPITPFDQTVLVETPKTPPTSSTGTAFAIAGEGLWMTARHVVEGCNRAALVVGDGNAVQADIQLARRSDIALLMTDGGPEALPIARGRSALRINQTGYHMGFPQGRPGEATSRLIGRETLQVRGRGQRDEPVLAWAEAGRTRGLVGTLAGLSGGPALDSRGQVSGVTIAEAPRRGRIYTTAPETFAEVAEARVSADERATGPRLSAATYGEVANELRRTLRVAQVVCLG